MTNPGGNGAENNTSPAGGESNGPTTPQSQAQGGLNAAQNRRNFLKAAVIGGVGVAAAGGAAAGIVLSSRNNAPVIRFGLQVVNFSPNDPCAICSTLTTAPYGQPTGGAFNSNEAVMIWLRFNTVPATLTGHQYQVTLSNVGDTCGGSVNFTYQGGGSAVQGFSYASGQTLACSPTSDPASTTGYSSLQLSTVQGTTGHNQNASSLPVYFTLSSEQDVLIRVHLSSCSSGTFTLTTALNDINLSTNQVTQIDTCHNDVVIGS